MLSGIQFVHKDKYVSKSLKKADASKKKREQKHRTSEHEQENTSTNTKPDTKAKREEWMLGDFDSILEGQTYKSHRGTRPIQLKGDPDTVKIINDRELNPFYLNGGNGLPSTVQLNSLHEELKDIPTDGFENESKIRYPLQLLKGIHVKEKKNIGHRKKVPRNQQQDLTIQPNVYENENAFKLNDKKESLSNSYTQDANELAFENLRREKHANIRESSIKKNIECELHHKLRHLVQLTTCSSDKGTDEKYDSVLKSNTDNLYKLGTKKNNSSLDTLYEETYTSGVSDFDTLIKKNIERYHFEEYGENHDEIGHFSEMRIKSKRLKTFPNQMLSKDYSKIDSEPLHQRKSKCLFCFDNETFEKARHISLIAVSPHAYLCYQSFKQCVVPFHLFISPKKHVGSSACLEEYVYQEIRNFQKSLVACLDTKNIGVVFIESMTYNVQKEKQFLGGGNHLVIECIGIPIERFEQCKIYFYKALSEYGDEWSQNKKLIPVPTCSQGCRNILPKNFPYFYVNFGLGEGYLHLIEDNSFSKSFGIEIIKGIMEMDRFTTCFSSTIDLQNAIVSFKKDYEKYDWTHPKFRL